ncbi:MAG: 16S rRNA (cytosine(967)-C(5))-methyltransferase RsmB [Clostridia bacterium]|nr:16S rRNA (cytosine(967)-C(5))-methyltransferase RsmB [Clostridia bacterium]
MTQRKNIDIKNVRSVAFEALKKCESCGQYSNIALDNALKKSELSRSDKGLATTLFYGVIEKRITLDYFISALSSRNINDIDKDTLILLRMGIYQLCFLDRVPDHAAINETVSLAPAKTRGFINAVLRAYTREAAKIKLPARDEGEVYSLSVRFSVGEKILEKLISVYGYERCEKMLSAIDGDSTTTLRTNTLKIGRDELVAKLGGEITELSPYGIKRSGQVSELYGFEDGLFYVQDEASQLCAMALGAKRGETVIDTCSCPGSKSFGIAIDMENEGELYSFDLHKNKLSLVESSAKRLGITIIRTEERDGRKPNEALLGKAHRVLCDVPCSGFGVMGKKPELRYKNPEESAALPGIQYDILKNSAKYLSAGGTLVYSTCTILPEENEKNVERFLCEHPDFALEPFVAGKLEVPSGMVTLLPDEYGTDGFFIAKLIKKK